MTCQFLTLCGDGDRIHKWLWCVGRLILATDNWSIHTNLSNFHSTTIITRQTDLGMNPGLSYLRLLLDFVSLFIILYFDYCYGFKEEAQILPDNPQVNTKINIAVCFPLAQLFSAHSMRMHKDRNALHCHSHTALRNWWFGLLGIL